MFNMSIDKIYTYRQKRIIPNFVLPRELINQEELVKEYNRQASEHVYVDNHQVITIRNHGLSGRIEPMHLLFADENILIGSILLPGENEKPNDFAILLNKMAMDGESSAEIADYLHDNCLIHFAKRIPSHLLGDTALMAISMLDAGYHA